jgi:hypothetical protein
MAETAPLNVTLYMRGECGLCDDVRKDLAELRGEFPHRLAEVDIDADPVLQTNYPSRSRGASRPVMLRAPISRQTL